MVDNINLEANNQLTNVEQPEIDSVHVYIVPWTCQHQETQNITLTPLPTSDTWSLKIFQRV